MNEIRREIEEIRLRIAGTVDGLAYKADVPSRLADVLGSAASSFTARLLHRLPGARSDTDAPAASGGREGPEAEPTVDVRGPL